jgi:glycosyltransferase involved in cell wall biosynthesis
MRILLTTHQFFPRHHAGTEVAARDAGLEMLRRGHDVHILTVEPNGVRPSPVVEGSDYEYRGLRVHALREPPRPVGPEAVRNEYRNVALADYVRQWAQRLGPDVVHVFHFHRLGGLALDALRELDVPLVFTSTDFWTMCVRSTLTKPGGELCLGPDELSSNCLECRNIDHRLGFELPPRPKRRTAVLRRIAKDARDQEDDGDPKSALVRAVLSRTEFLLQRVQGVDAILAPTKLMRDMLVRNGVRPDLIRVSPYSIDLSHFQTVRQSRNGSQSNSLRVGYIGTINPHKGVHVLLEAFRRLPENTRASLEVIGEPRTHPDYFERLVSIADGDPRIRFAGGVPNELIPERLKRIDVQVVPSTWYENAPLTIYSAQAAGVPVVASNLGGMAELVGHDENGLLFESGNVADLRRQLLTLAQHPKLLQRLRANARSPQSVSDGVEEMLSLYREVRGRRRRGHTEPGSNPAPERTAERAERPASIEHAEKSGPALFFLVGRAKSGTTWLMRILNAHPEIVCKGEGRFFGRSYRLPGQETRTIPARPLSGAFAASDSLRSWLERSVWARDGDAEHHLTELTRLAVDYFLGVHREQTGKRIAGDKTPFLTTDTVREISRVHPSAKVIHIIRDGRDVAISAKHHVWNRSSDAGGIHDLDPEDRETRDAYRSDPDGFKRSGRSIFSPDWLDGTATEWARMVEQGRSDGRELLGDLYLEVLYEDLLEEPDAMVGTILQFLTASRQAQTVRACIDQASFERATGGRKRGDERPTEFLRSGAAGQWKDIFTARDREVFKEAAGDLLIELGYERDGGW